MRFVDFYVVSADNVVGWSGQKMPGLNFCPQITRHETAKKHFDFVSIESSEFNKELVYKNTET